MTLASRQRPGLRRMSGATRVALTLIVTVLVLVPFVWMISLAFTPDFLSRQYFAGMPGALAEAARLDGAGELRIFWRIYLPLARPLVAVVAIFSFTGTWDDFLWPLVTTTSESTYTVQLALAQFNATGNVQYGPLMAGAILITLPVLAVFLFNQRSFIAGLADGSVKG